MPRGERKKHGERLAPRETNDAVRFLLYVAPRYKASAASLAEPSARALKVRVHLEEERQPASSARARVSREGEKAISSEHIGIQEGSRGDGKLMAHQVPRRYCYTRTDDCREPSPLNRL